MQLSHYYRARAQRLARFSCTLAEATTESTWRAGPYAGEGVFDALLILNDHTCAQTHCRSEHVSAGVCRRGGLHRSAKALCLF